MRPEVIQVIQFFSSLVIALIIFITNQIFQRKPKLITFCGHAAEVILKNPDGTEFKGENGQNVSIRSHSIVISNIGKLTAKNLKIIHGELPNNYTIFPPLNHKKEDKEITFDSLAPGELITITYLYFPPLYFSKINLHIKCDDCLAIPANMQHVHILPSWLKAILYFLLFVGAVTTIYFAIGALICFYGNCVIH